MTEFMTLLLEAIRISVQEPRRAARYVMGLDVAQSTGWLGLILSAVLSALLASVTLIIIPFEMDPSVPAFLSEPLPMAALQVVAMAVGAIMIQNLGAYFGGTGRMEQTLALLVWMEVILLLVQLAQTVLLLIAPPVGQLMGLGSLALFFWLMTQFVTELHGFSNPLKVFGTIIAAGFALSFALALIWVGIVGVEV